MDLEVAHAIAPDARLVVVNARPTVEGSGAFEKIGRMFDDAARQFPGSVWSLSIGWGCEALVTAADVAPVRPALANAHRRGIAVFDASGDTGGLECKGGEDWSSPPGPNDVGVDTIASLPEITSVGGTTLSTDLEGRWLEETGLGRRADVAGVQRGSVPIVRPPGLSDTSCPPNAMRRTVWFPTSLPSPIPFTGVKIIYEQSPRIGGGTSQSAPIWAALTVLMNQYVIDHGGRAARRHQHPSLSGRGRCRGCRDSAISRWAATPLTSPPGLRPGDRARQPQRLQPRPRSPRRAEGPGHRRGLSSRRRVSVADCTTARRAAMTPSVGTFCGACGASARPSAHGTSCASARTPRSRAARADPAVDDIAVPATAAALT